MVSSVDASGVNYYLRQRGYVLPDFVCLSVCLCVSKITQKVKNGSFWNFEGMSGMAQTTSMWFNPGFWIT